MAEDVARYTQLQLRSLENTDQSITVVTSTYTTSFARGVEGARVLVFGGHDGSDDFLGDMWELRLDELEHFHYLGRSLDDREDHCKWRFRGESDEHWRTACVNSPEIGGTGACSVEDIIQRTWCEGTGSSYYRLYEEERARGAQPGQVASFTFL